MLIKIMKYKISDLNDKLHGVATAISEDKKIIVPYVLPDEEVEVTELETYKKPPYAKEFTVIKADLKRQQPICKYYSKCGCCHTQHMNKEQYIFYKKGKLLNLLTDANIPHQHLDIQFISNIDNPYHVRRKADFNVFKNKIGFNLFRQYRTIDIDYCPILTQEINHTLLLLKPIITQHNQLLRLKEISCYDIDGKLIVILKSRIAFEQSFTTLFSELLQLNCVAQIFWYYNKNIFTPLIFKYPLFVSFGDYQIEILPQTFLQPEKIGEQHILQFIHRNIPKHATNLLNLFSGLGGYAIYLLNNHMINNALCVDYDKNAINAINSAGIDNLSAIKQDLINHPLNNDIISAYDTVIINPPRGGCYQQMLALVTNVKINIIILIYCVPDSLVRDMTLLLKHYDIIEIVVLDQFIYSYHIETLVCLKRKK